MAETSIQWTDYSFNSHHGCTKVSPACDHCYAETWSKRTGHPNLWGVDAGRRLFGEKHWAQPLKWNAQAANDLNAGELVGARRPRVFCNSMSDVFDNHPDVAEPRERLWRLIRATPCLDWLVLTKRIGNAEKMLPADWGAGYPNVWLGISVCEQREADRDVPKLLATPAAIRFLSCEPLLGDIDLANFAPGLCPTCGGFGTVASSGATTTFPEDDDGVERCHDCGGTGDWEDNEGLNWVIVGGESGHHARPMDDAWALRLRDQCLTYSDPPIAFFMKQMSQADRPDYWDFDKFPLDLQVRQWPKETP